MAQVSFERNQGSEAGLSLGLGERKMRLERLPYQKQGRQRGSSLKDVTAGLKRLLSSQNGNPQCREG